MMTTIPEQLADTLALAYAQGPEAVTEVLSAQLASHVTVSHLPPQPQDGVYSKVTLTAEQATRVAQFARVMANYHENAAISTLGTEITVLLEIGGTLTDGTMVSIVGSDVLTVENGEIVAMVSGFESDQMAALVAALLEGQTSA